MIAHKCLSFVEKHVLKDWGDLWKDKNNRSRTVWNSLKLKNLSLMEHSKGMIFSTSKDTVSTNTIIRTTSLKTNKVSTWLSALSSYGLAGTSSMEVAPTTSTPVSNQPKLLQTLFWLVRWQGALSISLRSQFICSSVSVLNRRAHIIKHSENLKDMTQLQYAMAF